MLDSEVNKARKKKKTLMPRHTGKPYALCPSTSCTRLVHSRALALVPLPRPCVDVEEREWERDLAVDLRGAPTDARWRPGRCFW